MCLHKAIHRYPEAVTVCQSEWVYGKKVDSEIQGMVMTHNSVCMNSLGADWKDVDLSSCTLEVSQGSTPS